MMNKIKYFMENYHTINKNNFAQNKIGKIIKDEIPMLIAEKINLETYDVMENKGSFGQGSKAEVPWYNLRLNGMKDKELYLTFSMMITTDGKGLYLAITQKYNFYKDRYGSKEGKIKARRFATEIISILANNGIKIPREIKNGEIDLRCKGDTAKGYEKSTILYKYYDIDSLPTDEQFINDIKQFLFLLKTLKEIKGTKSIANFFYDILKQIDEEGCEEFKYQIDTEEKDELEEEVEKKYYEGKRVTRTVTTSSPIRNKKLANDYKNYLKSKQEGKIWCEVCKRYEDISEILEVHHRIEVTNYEKVGKEYTTFKDVILLCPTCHKLLHVLGNLDEVEKYILD